MTLVAGVEGAVIHHEIAASGAVHQAIKDSNKAVAQKTAVIEKREMDVVQETQTDTSSGIASDIQRLRNNNQAGVIPETPTTTGGFTEGSAQAELLPNGSKLVVSEADEEACVTDYDLVLAWQQFYNKLLSVQSEESVNDAVDKESSSVSRIGGSSDSGGLQGRGRELDGSDGSNELVGNTRLSEVPDRSTVSTGSSLDNSTSNPESLLPSSTSDVRGQSD